MLIPVVYRCAFFILFVALSTPYTVAGQNVPLDSSPATLGPSTGSTANAECITEHAVNGDWLLDVRITAAGETPAARVMFSMQPEIHRHLALRLTPNEITLVRRVAFEDKVLDTYEPAGPPPWRVKVLKRGTYYIFYLNEKYLGFTFHPSTDVPPNALPTIWFAKAGTERALGRILHPSEPESTRFAVRFTSDGAHELRSLRADPIAFGTRRSPDPVIVPGSVGDWNDWHCLPGASIEYEGTRYVYLIGSRLEDLSLEGGGHTVNGLATSKDLRDWEVDPQGVVLGLGPEGSWDSVLTMVCGAARTPDGRFAITYMGWDGKAWGGIGLATADHPAGPFTKHPDNPVLKTDADDWDKWIHVHTLLQEKDRYVLLYTGASLSGPPLDVVGIATSKDLIHWEKDPRNPVILPEGESRFDSLVLRPRSLFKRGDYYYLFAEAAGTRKKFNPKEGGFGFNEDSNAYDTISLFRSKDLGNWERHPYNPAIPPRADFDAVWVAWPHAIPRDDGVWVFYAGSHVIGQASEAMRLGAGVIFFDWQELERWGRPIIAADN